MTGRILSLERDRRICIVDLVYFSPDRAVLGPMTLTVEVACVQGGSEMTIRQEGYQDGPDWNWYYEAVCAAWPKWPSPSNATQRIVVGSGNSEPPIPEILSRSVFGSKVSSRLR